jgi:glutathione S-transferase
MLIVHHLNNSRSQRIVWLLEELGLPYEIKFYQRDAVTNAAPRELKDIHPLGRSPILTDGDRVVAESAAIIDYIIRHHGNGRLAPPMTDRSYDDYVFWMNYAEGSAMLPLILKVNASRIGAAAAPIEARIDRDLKTDLGFINTSLEGRPYLLGDLTGADIQMSFVGELAGRWTDRTQYPNLDAWVKRFQLRPAYLRGIARGGAYGLAD